MNIHDKVIVLTGATGGIGREISSTLADLGARLILIGRDASALNTLRLSLNNADTHRIICGDLSTKSGIERISRELYMQHVEIDILINNAGISSFAFVSQQTSESMHDLLQTNLLAPMILCQSLLPMLTLRPKACIVNVGSSFGSIGFPGYASYCATKFGLRGFTEALRRELADSKIRVMYIAPRATATAINSSSVMSMNRQLGNHVDKPDVVARTIVRSIQSDRSTTFIGWPERFFIWLNAVVPALVDKGLRKKLPIIKSFAHV